VHATHSLQATVRIAFRRTRINVGRVSPDAGRERVLLLREKSRHCWWMVKLSRRRLQSLSAGVAARAEHHVTYYLGPFVRDPDGNNAEAVCHAPG
jgi:hypothetical protein